ncbi:hypothetical protein COCMIDRAFT_106869, partial [Bipolaris oryzae ATCC 44560]
MQVSCYREDVFYRDCAGALDWKSGRDVLRRRAVTKLFWTPVRSVSFPNIRSFAQLAIQHQR